MPHAINTYPSANKDVIAKSFFESRPQWFDEPVLNSWATSLPIRKVLEHVNSLYHQWLACSQGPFSPNSDPLWAETAKIQRDAGLPWHNNNLNLPEDIDKSWPFHFKDFERHVVLTKGARVGDNKASGYICNWTETNHYGIRAIQQELRRQMPDRQPLLVAGCIENDISHTAAQLFGLELLQLDRPWREARNLLEERTSSDRPIIAVTTLGNSRGEKDDFDAIRDLSQDLPIYLHVDASRTFDYLTTMSTSDRKRLGLPRLVLRHPFEDTGFYDPSEPTIAAATIVGAGMNSITPPPTVILKPSTLGTPSQIKVEYVRGTDSTLAGSRDALGPLLMCLQEARFGPSGIEEIYRRCQSNRTTLQAVLSSEGISVEAPQGSLDLLITGQTISKSIQAHLGLQKLADNAYMATVQPSVTKQNAAALVAAFRTPELSDPTIHRWFTTRQNEFPIQEELTTTIKSVVDHFRVVGKTSGGYPLNQAPYSALGPIVGHFLPLNIPTDWTEARAREILSARKSSFRLPLSEHKSFPACFTTGSTMGNRVGVHTALSLHPNAYFYYSSVTHYSVKKIIRDSDAVTSIWAEDKRPKFAEIPADDYGRMQIPLLIEQILKDQAHCAVRGTKHEIILFANIGTTFVGGRDDIMGIRTALRTINATISYLHVDGALDLGFAPGSVSLGPPELDTRDGLPVVQGLTLSHHKAFGIMVSGEVICYSPITGKIPTATHVDSRIVFETWLFQAMYSPSELLATREYCLSNASRLRRSLAALGLTVRHNDACFITLLERIPPWLVREFHLAPEGDWVHYIAMPHITPAAIAGFAAALLRVSMHFTSAFRALRTPLSRAFNRPVHLRRLRVHDEPVFRQVTQLAERTHDNRQGKFDLDAFRRRYVYSAMSYAATDENGILLAAFLAEADADRRITPGPVLVEVEGLADRRLIREIGRHGFEFLAQRMNLQIIRQLPKRPQGWLERRCSDSIHMRPRMFVQA